MKSRAETRTAASEATVVQGSWLGTLTLLCATTWLGRTSHHGLGGTAHSEDIAITLRAHVLALPNEADLPAGSLVVVAFNRPVAAQPSFGGLVLRYDRGSITFAPEDISSVIVDLQTLLRESLAARSVRTREAIMKMLVEVCGSDEGDATLARHLRAIRDVLRERRRPSVIAKESPQAVHIESIHRIDDGGFYVRGWSRDSSADTERLTAVMPEGARIELRDRLYRYPRVDLDEFYGGPMSGDAKSGFLAYFRTPMASSLADGWVFEIENAAGSAVEFAADPIEEDTRITRDTLLSDLYHELPWSSDLIRGQIHPALNALEQRRNEGIFPIRVEQYGIPPANPNVSVIVPLFGRIDFLEQQLAQFVHDPAMHEVDLLYVLDSPELSDGLLQSAAWMESLYGVPFRIAVADRNGGFAAANNVGASIARGRLLLLMNSDVFPDQPGWLAAMVRAYDTIPNVGVIGPKLLYEDGSLQHAGLYFDFDRVSGMWYNAHYFKGLHGSLPAAQVMRQVPAVTAACAMISAELYRELGGLQGKYIQGDYEDSDLCLRLYERGLGAWYVPDATLYHLEGQSYPTAVREMTGRYNRWLHSEVWGDLIPQVMADLSRRPAHRNASVGDRVQTRSISRKGPARDRRGAH